MAASRTPHFQTLQKMAHFVQQRIRQGAASQLRGCEKSMKWVRESRLGSMALAFLLCGGLVTGRAWAESAAQVLAAGEIPATATDAEGETIGGVGSSIALDEQTVVMLADRGPNDGKIDYSPRLQYFEIQTDGTKLLFRNVRTVVLCDAEGRRFSGLIPQTLRGDLPALDDGRECLDPEEVVLAPDGRIFISEEYSPGVLEFSPDGKLVRRFEVPADLVPRQEGQVAMTETDEDDLTSGREPNRGFEGMTLLPDGKHLAAILQSAPVQDGGRKAGFSRLYVFDIATGKATAAYRIPFSNLEALEPDLPPGKKIKPSKLVFNALAALPDGRILALERENFGADGTNDSDPARWKAVVVLNLAGAENFLETGTPAPEARPAESVPLFNLAALEVPGLPRELLPAKWEGLAIRSLSPEGHLNLLLSSDNDFFSPSLSLRDTAGQLRSVPFPDLEVPQGTWVVEVETHIPPANPTPSE
jgi:hypothetical protein